MIYLTKKKELNCIIILEKEKNKLISCIHIGLGHLGINRLQYEIFRRGYYWYGMTKDIINYVHSCILCTEIKLNKPVKPINKQIISYYPMERIVMDLTYLKKLYSKNNSKYNYIFCLTDHFSKMSKTYLTITKEAKEIIIYLKDFLDKYGNPKIIQSDNGGEFTANIIKNLLKDRNIIFINSSAHHPQTNGVVEAFNKIIINKFETILIENKKLDIKKALEKAETIYNNTIHSTTKVEPIKAFNFKDQNDINNDIKNVIKSQKKIYEPIKMNEKCLLNDIYILDSYIIIY